MSAASVMRAAARAMLAVLLSVAIWVGVYGLSESVFGDGGVWAQATLLLALPIVVLATLLYAAFERWRRQVGGGSEPPPLRWKVAGVVLALVLASAIWAGAYAYAASLSSSAALFIPVIILGVPPVLGMVILIYAKLSAASRR